ncbi:putative quinol monooxygenase [Sediminibacterium goheungense]|uniref:Quinol monooxygenase YgiN n=1 Tax=Sediminibacterium goheungense TaxID=1086393 RepID=A0A4R6ITF6_9BACT|nr:antibiotic biosynthesis monooxygenase [Sediminibacterium goheungense]TDO25812.1 quinol monooxygenase YgiN [Sediminibacterium goheungense]
MKTTDTISFYRKKPKTFLSTFLLVSGLFSQINLLQAQEQKQMVRLAKIKVDPVQLYAYNKALLTQMKTAIAKEPGVVTYYAVADKKDPSSITILEIYADTSAYQKHILTSHFKKYKDTVKDMVTSLELMDVTMIGFAKKPNH